MEAKADRLKALITEMRGELGLRAFARVVGVSPGAMHNWQEGLNQPDKNGLQKLARLKGWTVDELSAYLDGLPFPSPDEISMPALREAIKKLTAAQALEVVQLALPIVGGSCLDSTDKSASIAFSRDARVMTFSQLLQRFLGAIPPDIVDAQLTKKRLTRSRLNELIEGSRPTDEDVRKVGAILGDVGFKDGHGEEYSIEQLERMAAGSSITNGASSR